MKDLQALQQIGLSEREVQTYVALLEQGPTSIRQLAATTNINRGTTYDNLQRLSSLGLVSFNRRNQRRKFFAESPEKIYDLITERRKELTNTALAARRLVPNLMALSQHSGTDPVVRFYEDDEGVVTILRDVLNTVAKLDPKEYHVYSSRAIRQYIYRKFPNFTRQRLKDGIFVKVIAIGEGGDPVQQAERRWLPESDEVRFSSYNIIYGDKLAMIAISPDEVPYGVVIEEPGVAAMQRLLFDQLWQHLPEVT